MPMLFSFLTTTTMALLLLLLVGTIEGRAISASSCLSSEASILLRIKEDLQLSNGRLSSWVINGSNDCCMWEGVSCDPCTGHVIGLQLCGGHVNPHDIIGSRIPLSLFELHQLQHLDLSGCDFNGSAIPPELAHLTRLTHLNLSCSRFSGRIPHEISSLSDLVSLDLSNISPPYIDVSYLYYDLLAKFDPNYLELQDLEAFVQNFKHLEYLNLNKVSINVTDPREWGISLSLALPNLRSLNLAYCYLEGNLPPTIGNLTILTHLDLSHNNISGNLSPTIGNLKALTHLDLSFTYISGSHPATIGNLKTLSHLDLSYTNISGSIHRTIGNLKALAHLDLSFTHISGSLPATIGNLKALTELYLYDTNISGNIPPTIGNLTALTCLEFSSTHFSGSLPPTIRNLTTLTYLGLSNCMLTSIFDSSCFVNLTQLTYLDLSKNMISGSLPSLPQYQYPTIILLGSNNFSGPIPNSYIFFKIMKLGLSDNSLTGTIPSSPIYDPSSVQSPLQYLDLSNNKLDGYLDLEIFSNFKNLFFLSLSGNNFTVDVHNPTLEFPNLQQLTLVSCNINQFPQFLRHHKSIDTLDLSNNMITGAIPKWLNISYSLNISYNMLTSIEQGFSFNLMMVDLSFNMLNSLPNSLFHGIGSFQLSYLSVSNNYVTGEIPVSLCNFTWISLLDLSNNKLTGQIPECLFNLTNLVGVMLQNNQLQGQIPEFTKNQFNILDLSDNRLEGYIPTSLGYCKDLEWINLGHNKLIGGFPSWLGKLSYLRVLVLRSNSLSGAINFTFNQNTFQELHLLDISTNRFTRELPLNLLSGLNAMKIFNNISTIPMTYASGYVIEWKVTMDTKGTNLTYEWKASIMTMIDLSNNCFEGEISKEIGDLSGLQALKLSHNKLKGPIPKTIGALEHLESLDLSHNYLSGIIPEELITLNSLGYLNLSYNNLSGRIPQSPHFSTFDVPSFEGNPSLCGPPLSLPCEANKNTIFIIPFVGLRGEDEEKMWKYISIGLGFGAGFGTAISFSYFLDNRRCFNSFWRRCYWLYT